MLIIGAGGHAKEVAGILIRDKTVNEKELFFFDDQTAHENNQFLGFPVLTNMETVRELFQKDAHFILALGKPMARKRLATLLRSQGGILSSVISTDASIGVFSKSIGAGVNIMTRAVITENAEIGEGALIHIHTIVHHDVKVGDYCEISPGAILLGKCSIGEGTSIGAGAVILPGIKVGRNAIVGAGAVVTKDVSDGELVVGVPARLRN